MKKFLTIAATLLIVAGLGARDRNRHPFETQFNAIPNKAEVFKPGAAWFPYPAYSDRQGWDNLLGEEKSILIKRGESKLKFKWQLTTAMDYIEFEKDGDRKHIKAENADRGALSALIMAELAEGKGRFIPQIIDGLFFYAEKSTWQYAVHTSRQKSHRHLPDPEERYISLGAANTASTIAIAWHFLHEEFDKIDPVISRIVLDALEKNTFGPYLDDTKTLSGHGWMGFGKGKVNNWNTYCNTFCMEAFLLAQQDPEKLLKALEKGMKVMDNYMDYAKMDGACEEGPSYWNMAGAKVYDFSRLMYDASYGKIDMINDTQVRNMCKWKSDIDLGDGWTVNYGDGGARSAKDATGLFRMGVDQNCQELIDFSLYMLARPQDRKFVSAMAKSDETYRNLEVIRYNSQLLEAEEKAINDVNGNWDILKENLRRHVKSAYYPETQTAVLRNTKGWILAPKGGNNGESHNHNDVGSFVLFINECPIFVDPGSGTYGKTTFGPQRYTANWQMRSEGHNLVTVNGIFEKDGEKMAASGTKCDLNARTFSTDIAGAFPEDAACQSWVREFQLGEDEATITETYKLGERKSADDIHFVTSGKVTLSKNGEILLKCYNFSQEYSTKVKINYPKNLTATVETVELTNPGLTNVWGDHLTRIVLKSSDKAPLSGKYTIKISKQ